MLCLSRAICMADLGAEAKPDWPPMPGAPEIVMPTLRRFSPFTSLRALWVAVLLILFLAALLVQPIYQPDFWWHVKMGELVLAQGQVPEEDLFSYTVPGRPFIYQGWLAGVVLALLYHAGGAIPIILGNAFFLLAAYALLLWHCWVEGRNTRLAVGATFLALVVSAGNWAVRPQTFSVLLFVALYIVLDRYRQGRRSPLWAVPLGMALWANLHGAFITGFLLLGATIGGEVLKRWLPGRPLPVLSWSRVGWLTLTAGLSVGAIFLNPVGPRILRYVLNIWSNPAIRGFIAEWQPTGTEMGTGLIFLGSLVGYLLILNLRRRTPDPTDLLLFLATAWLALGGVRNLLWYGLVLAPLLARALAGREEPPEPFPNPVLNTLIVALVTIIVVLATPWVKGILPLPEDLQGTLAADTPIATAEAVHAQGLTGRVFNQMESGGYLAWRLWPETQLFIDSRIELYTGEVWQDYLHISAGRTGYQELLDRYGVQFLVLNGAAQGGLVQQVQDSSVWVWVYENSQEGTVVYRRRAFIK